MPNFDPNFPPTNCPLQSTPFRNQFNSLKTLIDAVPAGPQGPPGEVTQAALDGAIAGTANNVNAVGQMGFGISDPPTQSEVQQIYDKLNEVLGALYR